MQTSVKRADHRRFTSKEEGSVFPPVRCFAEWFMGGWGERGEGDAWREVVGLLGGYHVVAEACVCVQSFLVHCATC